MLKNKAKVNFVIDALMFIDIALIAGLGFLMKFVLLPGREKVLKYGANIDLFLFGLDRHQWGTVHLYASLTLLALLAVHILLHWSWITANLAHLITLRGVRIVVAVVFVLICTGLFALPLLVPPERSDAPQYLHRNAMERGPQGGPGGQHERGHRRGGH
jgi:hypothetical protein